MVHPSSSCEDPLGGDQQEAELQLSLTDGSTHSMSAEPISKGAGSNEGSSLSVWRHRVRVVFFPYSLPLLKESLLSRGAYENIVNIAMVIHFVLFLTLYGTDAGNNSVAFPSVLRIFDAFFTAVYVFDWILRAFTFRMSWVRSAAGVFSLFVTTINVVFVIALFSTGGAASWADFYVAVFRVALVPRLLFSSKRLRGLRLVVNAMRASLASLGPVFLIFTLLFTWFGVAGMQQLKGSLVNRCVNSNLMQQRPTLSQRMPPSEVSRLLAAAGKVPRYMAFNPHLLPSSQRFNVSTWPVSAFVCGGVFETYLTNASSSVDCSPHHVCDTSPPRGVPEFLRGYICPFSYACESVGNPYSGIVGFDNAAQSELTVFVLSTLSGFFDVMYWSRGASTALAYGYYAAFLLIVCSLFLNIFLFVITNEFQKSITDAAAKAATLVVDLYEDTLRESLDASHSRVGDGDDPSKKLPERIFAVARRIVSSPYFENTTMFLIGANLVILATYHYEMNNALASIIAVAEYFFAVVFAVEVVLRFLASKSTRIFFKDLFNIADVACAAVPVLELAFSPLKALRVVRVFKLLRQFPAIQSWLAAVGTAIRGSPLPLSLLSLSVAAFAAYLVQVTVRYHSPPASNQLHYNTMGSAMAATLQVVSADSWDVVLYDSMTQVGPWIAIVFAVFFIFVNFFLLNILVGIMLTAIPPADAAAKVEEPVEDRGWLSAVMSVIILLNAVAMGLENPMQAPDTTRAQVLFYVDVTVTGLFVIEIVVRCGRHGLIRGEKAYLRRSHWNKIDFVLVIISVLGLLPFLLSTKLAFVRVVRVLRVLRPLRLGTQILPLQLVMRTIASASKQLWCVGVVVIAVMFMWSVAGVFLFAGALQQCRVGKRWFPDLDVASCHQQNGSYQNPGAHFDNFLAGFVSCMRIIALHGWAEIMKALADSQGPQMPQRGDARPWAMLFPASLAVFGGMVVVNLFGAVLIVSYNALTRNAEHQKAVMHSRSKRARAISKKRMRAVFASVRAGRITVGGKSLVADDKALVVHSGSDLEEFASIEMTDAASMEAPLNGGHHHHQPSSTKMNKLARSKRLMVIVNASVLVSVATSAAHGANAPTWVEVLSLATNATCCIIFAAEFLIKMKGLGAQEYFGRGWNRFDFAVMLFSIFGTTAEIFTVAGTGNDAAQRFVTGTALIRTSRLLRALHLVGRGSPAVQLLTKIINGVWDLRYVGLLSGIVLYIYAVAGVQLFGLLQHEPFGLAAGAIDSYNNFDSLFNSLVTLVRGLSEGTWPKMIIEGGKEQPDCLARIGNCGIGYGVPAMFFISFFIWGRFLFLNLAIAVLLDTFFSSTRSLAVTRAEALDFTSCWLSHSSRGDPNKMEAAQLLDFFRSLSSRSVLGRLNRQRRGKRLGTEVRFLLGCRFHSLDGLVSRKIVRDVLFQYTFPLENEDVQHEEVLTWERPDLEDLVSVEREQRLAVLMAVLKDWIRRRRMQHQFFTEVQTRLRAGTLAADLMQGSETVATTPRVSPAHDLASSFVALVNSFSIDRDALARSRTEVPSNDSMTSTTVRTMPQGPDLSEASSPPPRDPLQ